MVNSGSLESDAESSSKNEADDLIATDGGGGAQAILPCHMGGEQTTEAIEPTATKTDNLAIGRCEGAKLEDGVLCRLPLAIVQGALRSYLAAKSSKSGGTDGVRPASKRVGCLFCDRTFGSVTLRQKHVDRCHSVKYNRRLSVRIQGDKQTACAHCAELDGTSYTLRQLFEHLVSAHSAQYFACWDCQERFPSSQLLDNHLGAIHKSRAASPETTKAPTTSGGCSGTGQFKKPQPKERTTTTSANGSPTTRLRNRSKDNEGGLEKAKRSSKKSGSQLSSNTSHIRDLRGKKLSVISSKVRGKQSVRVTRQQAKMQMNLKKAKRKAKTKKAEEAQAQKVLPSSTNPYPTFDLNFRVKKITDHSIDNLKIASMTFDDVFDKAFYNRVKCNIRDNLLNHIDGKLFKSVESENRILSFQKCANVQSDMFSQTYGCEISSNAIAPVASLLSGSQFGEDIESQIEYGTKASKKKSITSSNKDDEVHYKYFTRRKYQEAIKESQKHRDLSKLDMWTQLAVKNRQEKVISSQKTPKEMVEYTRSDEYKTKLQVEELNDILDKRGPLEDLRAEAIRAGALTMLNGDSPGQGCLDVVLLLNDILNKVCSSETPPTPIQPKPEVTPDLPPPPAAPTEIPEFLDLQPSRIALPSSSADGGEDGGLLELTGEWARSRVYVCASCAEKTPAINKLIDHKNLAHPHVWCQHYEFVGTQEELCEHLSIPVLGKVGELEKGKLRILCQKGEARVCTKCDRGCTCMNDLHRHMLECGGDWTWLMERKKYKYRYYGSKPRKKRCLLKFCQLVRERKAPCQKKKLRRFDRPRSKPDDAETIQRMLANLPAKRATRKIMSLKDGFPTARKKPTVIKQIAVAKKKNAKLLSGARKQAQSPANIGGGSGGVTASGKKPIGMRSRPTRTRKILLRSSASRVLEPNVIIRRKSVRNIQKVLGSKIVKRSNRNSRPAKLEERTESAEVAVKKTNESPKPKRSSLENETGKKGGEKKSPPKAKVVSEIKKVVSPEVKKTPSCEVTEGDEQNNSKISSKKEEEDKKAADERISNILDAVVKAAYSQEEEAEKLRQEKISEILEAVIKATYPNGTDAAQKKRVKKKPNSTKVLVPKKKPKKKAKQQQVTAITKIVQIDGSSESKTAENFPETSSQNAETQELPAVEKAEDVPPADDAVLDLSSTGRSTSAEHLNMDEPLNLVVNKTQTEPEPEPAPKTKTKPRRSKGLNDCIAMLTNKLQERLGGTPSLNSQETPMAPPAVCQETPAPPPVARQDTLVAPFVEQIGVAPFVEQVGVAPSLRHQLELPAEGRAKETRLNSFIGVPTFESETGECANNPIDLRLGKKCKPKAPIARKKRNKKSSKSMNPYAFDDEEIQVVRDFADFTENGEERMESREENLSLENVNDEIVEQFLLVIDEKQNSMRRTKSQQNIDDEEISISQLISKATENETKTETETLAEIVGMNLGHSSSHNFSISTGPVNVAEQRKSPSFVSNESPISSILESVLLDGIIQTRADNKLELIDPLPPESFGVAAKPKPAKIQKRKSPKRKQNNRRSLNLLSFSSSAREGFSLPHDLPAGVEQEERALIGKNGARQSKATAKKERNSCPAALQITQNERNFLNLFVPLVDFKVANRRLKSKAGKSSGLLDEVDLGQAETFRMAANGELTQISIEQTVKSGVGEKPEEQEQLPSLLEQTPTFNEEFMRRTESQVAIESDDTRTLAQIETDRRPKTGPKQRKTKAGKKRQLKTTPMQHQQQQEQSLIIPDANQQVPTDGAAVDDAVKPPDGATSESATNDALVIEADEEPVLVETPNLARNSKAISESESGNETQTLEVEHKRNWFDDSGIGIDQLHLETPFDPERELKEISSDVFLEADDKQIMSEEVRIVESEHVMDEDDMSISQLLRIESARSLRLTGDGVDDCQNAKPAGIGEIETQPKLTDITTVSNNTEHLDAKPDGRKSARKNRCKSLHSIVANVNGTEPILDVDARKEPTIDATGVETGGELLQQNQEDDLDRLQHCFDTGTERENHDKNGDTENEPEQVNSEVIPPFVQDNESIEVIFDSGDSDDDLPLAKLVPLKGSERSPPTEHVATVANDMVLAETQTKSVTDGDDVVQPSFDDAIEAKPDNIVAKPKRRPKPATTRRKPKSKTAQIDLLPHVPVSTASDCPDSNVEEENRPDLETVLSLDQSVSDSEQQRLPPSPNDCEVITFANHSRRSGKSQKSKLAKKRINSSNVIVGDHAVHSKALEQQQAEAEIKKADRKASKKRRQRPKKKRNNGAVLPDLGNSFANEEGEFFMDALAGGRAGGISKTVENRLIRRDNELNSFDAFFEPFLTPNPDRTESTRTDDKAAFETLLPEFDANTEHFNRRQSAPEEEEVPFVFRGTAENTASSKVTLKDDGPGSKSVFDFDDDLSSPETVSTAADLRQPKRDSFSNDASESVKETEAVGDQSDTNGLEDSASNAQARRRSGRNRSCSLQKSVNEDNDNTSNSYHTEFGDTNSASGVAKTNRNERKKSNAKVNLFCDICQRSFTRTESLVKHKRTLTHIAKLSELEALEQHKKNGDSEPAQPDLIQKIVRDDFEDEFDFPSKEELNIANILQTTEASIVGDFSKSMFTLGGPARDALQLADIISDVLSRPVGDNHFSDLVLKSDSELKRYKSLGERKSFDSDTSCVFSDTEPAGRSLTSPFIGSKIPSTADKIVEKQISLLENIIEDNRTSSELAAKLANKSQYEEISEDSASVILDEQNTMRKVLNRDEELFLECCSLLKSSSDTTEQPRKHLAWPPKPDNFELSNDSDSNILGDNFYEDVSSNSSTTFSSINAKARGLREGGEVLSHAVFEDISTEGGGSSCGSVGRFNEMPSPPVSDYEDGEVFELSPKIESAQIPVDIEKENVPAKLASKLVKKKVQSRKKKPLPSHQPQITDYAEVLPSEKACALCDNKKVLTKGAMKVFEGLKVSIPKDELDMAKVLNCSPISKRLKLESAATAFQFPKSDDSTNLKVNSPLPVLDGGQKKLFDRPVGNKLGLKCTKKKQQQQQPAAPSLNDVFEKKLHDVYDFEETQDNIDVFSGAAAGTLPMYSTFRNKFKDRTAWDDEDNGDGETKIGVAKSITKKKCVIMGRIFKNAAKPKPGAGGAELLEDYVNGCRDEQAPHKLSEEEMNSMFDQLLHGGDEQDDRKNPDCVQCVTKEEAAVMPAGKKQAAQRAKTSSRQRKRQRANSVDSDDEEFRIGKPARKRSNRKNGQDDGGINLEQELKECIGVASRKSQRSCTSGKQNILVEYWSSDDSNLEEKMAAFEESIRLNNEEKQIETEVAPVETSTQMEIEPVVEAKVDNFKKPKPAAGIKKKPVRTKRVHRPSDSTKRKKVSRTAGAADSETIAASRQKRNSANSLYYWSSSSDDETQDMIEVKPIRDEYEDDEDRPLQHGWIVGESPKKLVTMLAQAKGKNLDAACVKEQNRRRTSV